MGIQQQNSTSFSKNQDASKPGSSNTKTMPRSEIGVKWPKLSANDLAALKGRDDLISQVVSKYGVEKAQAQREVDTLMNGRHFE
jgi:hypothetical protein